MEQPSIETPQKRVIELVDVNLKEKVHSEILNVLDKHQVDENMAIEVLENICFDIRLEQRLSTGDDEDEQNV